MVTLLSKETAVEHHLGKQLYLFTVQLLYHLSIIFSLILLWSKQSHKQTFQVWSKNGFLSTKTECPYKGWAVGGPHISNTGLMLLIRSKYRKLRSAKDLTIANTLASFVVVSLITPTRWLLLTYNMIKNENCTQVNRQPEQKNTVNR